MRDMLTAIMRLKQVDDTSLRQIAEHDPGMIREVVSYLDKQNRTYYEKLERFETIQSAILEFLKIEA